MDRTPSPAQSIVRVPVVRSDGQRIEDSVSVEEPLEIRVSYGPSTNRSRHIFATTMRTPGDDHTLAAGLFATEGVVKNPQEIIQIDHDSPNEIRVQLHPDVNYSPSDWQRSGYSNSSCGLCGKWLIDANFENVNQQTSNDFPVHFEQIPLMLKIASEHQGQFTKTGGIHSAMVFDNQNHAVIITEDIGRHNAVDKALGSLFLKSQWPLTQNILIVSSRASFEIVQKAAMASLPVVITVGAASSLAIDLANHSGMTLIGFARGDRFNIYTHEKRIRR
jgi:FdhD protein